MAKHIDELTVGIVTKVMTRIGYGCFLGNGKLVNSLVFETYEQAKRRADESCMDLEVKPVYIEESPK